MPAPVRRRDRAIGSGEPVLPRYERIAFEKSRLAPPGQPPAAFVCPGHPLLDAVIDLTLERHRDLLKRGAVLVDELDPGGAARHLHYAPYLDYRPLAEGDPSLDALLDHPQCVWLDGDLESRAQRYAVADVVPQHLKEVRDTRLALIAKTEAAVKERLTKEISSWDHHAEQLKLQEQAGQTGARLNSMEARKRADHLQARLKKRLEALTREAQLSP